MKIFFVIITGISVSAISYFLAKNDIQHDYNMGKPQLDTVSPQKPLNLKKEPTIKHNRPTSQHSKLLSPSNTPPKSHELIEKNYMKFEQDIDKQYKALFLELSPSSAMQLKDIILQDKISLFEAMLENKAIDIQLHNEIKERLIAEALTEKDHETYLLFIRMKQNL